jgi:tetratricopeptide (TPR) repeat protein
MRDTILRKKRYDDTYKHKNLSAESFNLADGFRQQAVSNYMEGKYDGAIADCHKGAVLLKDFCGDIDVSLAGLKIRNILGHCYQKSGDFETAKKHYQYVINDKSAGVESEIALAYVALAAVCYSEKDIDKALENYSAGIGLFNKLRSQHPDRSPDWNTHDYDNLAVGLLNRAQIYFEKGEIAQAKTDIKEAKKVNPKISDRDLEKKVEKSKEPQSDALKKIGKKPIIIGRGKPITSTNGDFIKEIVSKQDKDMVGLDEKSESVPLLNR